MKIYVASSWRNTYQSTVVAELRRAGHDVYDFTKPEWNGRGFHWTEIDGGYHQWDFDEYQSALAHPLAVVGFKADMDALEWCDVCALVLPCGRSAHLELGWAVGKGKRTCILHEPEKVDPELMSKMVDGQFCCLVDLLTWLQ